MEESISGFKVRGDWGDVVEHGERISRALRDAGIGADDPDRPVPDGSVDGDGSEADDEADDEAAEDDHPDREGRKDREDQFVEAFREWEEWRPKAHETLESDVSEKTADQASVEEGKGEKAGKEPDEDIKTAGEKLSESYEQLEEDDPEAAVDNWRESIDYVARAADSASRKALRRVEDTVYQNVMTQLAPYYFDNDLVSANIQQSARGNDDAERFVFEVNINDDDLKAAVSDRLAELEDEVDRWHVQVEKDTDAAEAIEGAEPPPEPEDDEPKSTTN
ncbi:hypothetical protein SAMN05444422_10564 [Halobiforma haloterrestris]|uniref:Uncharacterized protein n=1 Tax=Natronobacterium haloterrestre TaxID=148448 RepID=A0A1I1GWV4_NATHA|nr:DUF5828 family protein [Halobiforma haloterrestris]SFC15995.1 hypothetical protein SAMN05444422_10564 [Halobiforma haloterrestris]